MSTVSMPGIATTESTLKTSDGANLYTKTWHPSSTTTVLARLVFVHGFSDHCNFYGILFPTLASRGISVHAYDQRGWGRSVHKSSEKGLTGPTSLIMQDLNESIASLPSSNLPTFLMGHSMGGGEILYYAATTSSPPIKLRGYLAESPYIQLHPSEMPYSATVIAGKLLGKILPKHQMVRKLDVRNICRDPEVCAEWDQDPLCHDTGTLECLAAMIDRAKDLEEGKVTIQGGDKSVWIGFGTGDKLLDFNAAKKWFETKLEVEDKEFRIYDGWYHKLHAEPGEDKYKFAKDVGDWILARSTTDQEDSSMKPKL